MSKEVFCTEKEKYTRITGDKSPMRYECMECGCVFFGAWHSQYSISDVVCPVCDFETDSAMIKYKPE